MSVSMAQLGDDRFGETEHRNFLNRLFSFLEYYRKKISNLVIYIPIGKIIITCFNYLCSFFLKYTGFQPEPIVELNSFISVGFLENHEKLERSEKEKAIEEDFKRRMKMEREKLEQKFLELQDDCKEFDDHFEEEKKKSLQRIEEAKREAEEERIEKDKAVNSETDTLIRDTREKFEKFMTSKESSSDTDRENTVKLNKDLSEVLDNLESKEELPPIGPTAKKSKKQMKI